MSKRIVGTFIFNQRFCGFFYMTLINQMPALRNKSSKSARSMLPAYPFESEPRPDDNSCINANMDSETKDVPDRQSPVRIARKRIEGENLGPADLKDCENAQVFCEQRQRNKGDSVSWCEFLIEGSLEDLLCVNLHLPNQTLWTSGARSLESSRGKSLITARNA